MPPRTRPIRPGAARTSRAAARPARSPAPIPPAPAFFRDPWAWASVLAVLIVLAACAGAPLGEAVAEDFDFLRRALLEGMGTLLDGGGSSAFWRPIPHQLYYALLGNLIVTHPTAVAGIHVACLALGTALLYRAFRIVWSGPLAACAATFPLFSESTRTLIGWPSHFVDLGLFLFIAIALHESSRRRLPTTLVALVLALLCKEVALVAAILIPLMPYARERRERIRWAIACTATAGAWGMVYLVIRQHAHLALPHGIEQDPALLSTPLTTRFAWALAASLRALMSLPIVADSHELLALALALLVTVAALTIALRSAAARARLVAVRAWVAWGLAWFLLSTATLTPIFPLWQPNRSHLASAGLGVATAAALGAVHPGLAAAVVGSRLVMLALAPPAARVIASAPPATGAFMDFAKLTRLQRFMRATRIALHEQVPRPPHGSYVIEANFPRGLLYALGGDHALQVWFRDSTLHVANAARLRQKTDLPAAAVIQYQPDWPRREIVILPADALRAQDRAYRAVFAGDNQQALELIDKADAIAPDTSLAVFHGNNAGMRALALSHMNRLQDAEAEAHRAIRLYPLDYNARVTLAAVLIVGHRLDEAEAVIRHLQRTHAGDKGVRTLAEALERERREPGSARRP